MFLQQYWRTPHSSTNVSPGKVLFAREIRALCDVMVPRHVNKENPVNKVLFNNMFLVMFESHKNITEVQNL